MKKLVSLFVVMFVAVIAMFLTGCATTGSTNLRQDQATVAIQKGVTTEADLIRMFGPPQSTTFRNGGVKILGWSECKSDLKPESYIPVAGYFMGGVKSTSRSLRATIDPNGIVSDSTFSTDEMNFGYNSPANIATTGGQ